MYISRPEPEGRLRRAVELGLNVVVAGPPGIGKTTLTRQVLSGHGPPPDGRLIWVDGVGSRPHDLVERIALAFGWDRPTTRWRSKSSLMAILGEEVAVKPDPERIEPDDVELLEGAVHDAPQHFDLSVSASETSSDWIVVVDSPPARAFDELWIKHRERLWALPIRWIVLSARTPIPTEAKIFFDVEVSLEEFDSETAFTLIHSRLQASGAVSTERARRLTHAIVGQVPARPRDLIIAARDSVLSEGREAEARYARYSRLSDKASAMSRAHAMVLAELIAARGGYASDTDLQRRTGYSRQRLAQVLDDLFRAELVKRARYGRRIVFLPSDDD